MASFNRSILKVMLPLILIISSISANNFEDVRDVESVENAEKEQSLLLENAIEVNSESSAIDPKLAEIVKNPVNADLNKLPSHVIDKIAEGGVTPSETSRPKMKMDEPCCASDLN